MNDKEQIEAAYQQMYRCMIAKDCAGLAALLDEDFVLVHMTGMRQPKAAFLQAVEDGTLHYDSATHENVEIAFHGDHAELLGQSRVNAAVFGGGPHTWRLQQRISLRKTASGWKMLLARASTYETAK